MRKSKFAESQVVGILKEAESGVPVADLLRRHGISKTTFFKWRSQVRGGVGGRCEAAALARRRERQAEADVRRPGARERRHQGCPGPKTVTPSAKRQALDVLVAEHQLPIRRACQIVRLSRAAYYRPPVSSARRDAPVIAALLAVVTKHGRWGFWKCSDRLRLEGYRWNHKRVHRVYCALRLNLPRRTKRRLPHRVRRPLVAPPVLNQTWALDFMADALYDRRRFRALTILDEGLREGLAIDVGRSIPARRLIRVLEELIALHGRPAALRMDNGPELTAQAFVEW